MHAEAVGEGPTQDDTAPGGGADEFADLDVLVDVEGGGQLRGTSSLDAAV